MKSGGKCLLWSSCAPHLGTDYYFFFFQHRWGCACVRWLQGGKWDPWKGWVVVGFGVLGEKYISTTSLLGPRLQRHSRLHPFQSTKCGSSTYYIQAPCGRRGRGSSRTEHEVTAVLLGPWVQRGDRNLHTQQWCLVD